MKDCLVPNLDYFEVNMPTWKALASMYGADWVISKGASNKYIRVMKYLPGPV